MKHRPWFVLLAAAGLLSAVPGLVQAQDKASGGKKRVLLVTHSGGFVHSSVVAAEKVLKEIGPKNGFEVTCWRYTNDPDKKVTYKKRVGDQWQSVEGTSLDAYSEHFRQATKQPVDRSQIGRINADTLKNFDAVFFFTTGNPVENDSEMAALLDFVKSGKGFLGTHCATDTLYSRKDYGEMIGAYFDGHPMVGKTRVVVEDTEHPITQGLGKAFDISDELYQFRDPYSRDKLRVLMKLDPRYVIQMREAEIKRAEKEKLELPKRIAAAEDAGSAEAKKLRKRLRDLENFKPSIKRSDNDYAMAWVREYGKGRVFYTALGHGENVWDDPRFQRMIVQAIRWATREIDGPADPLRK
jgi:type 1 glutamine amidotransferase